MGNAAWQTELHEVCPGVFRLSTWDEAAGITFNQFLLQDDKPTLIETGQNRLFAAVKSRIAEVLDPASLCYICPTLRGMNAAASTPSCASLRRPAPSAASCAP
jgi:hypothetical protein